MSDYIFKSATTPWELDQIRELNYLTFVEEIPQHSTNETHSLIDRFENESSFFICLDGAKLVGMLALRANRPFSLDEKIPELDSYLPPHQSACEIRLLAVRPEHRNGRVFIGLIQMIREFFNAHGHDIALISGTLRQTKLYRHMGFVPFGPVVGTKDAPYQPMYLFLEQFEQSR